MLLRNDCSYALPWRGMQRRRHQARSSFRFHPCIELLRARSLPLKLLTASMRTQRWLLCLGLSELVFLHSWLHRWGLRQQQGCLL
jgi:hypothetical protein